MLFIIRLHLLLHAHFEMAADTNFDMDLIQGSCCHGYVGCALQDVLGVANLVICG